MRTPRAHTTQTATTTAHILGVRRRHSPPAGPDPSLNAPTPHHHYSANTWIDALADSLGADHPDDVTAWAKYSASLYWSVMTLTSIGYGAMLPPDDNSTEHFVCSLLMMFSSLFWIYLTGQFCAIASNMDQVPPPLLVTPPPPHPSMTSTSTTSSSIPSIPSIPS